MLLQEGRPKRGILSRKCPFGAPTGSHGWVWPGKRQPLRLQIFTAGICHDHSTLLICSCDFHSS